VHFVVVEVISKKTVGGVSIPKKKSAEGRARVILIEKQKSFVGDQQEQWCYIIPLFFTIACYFSVRTMLGVSCD
jgi:hypothetical protein